MKFKILLLSFVATGCFANENPSDPNICNIVKKVAYNVMEARQKKVPAQDLQQIANGLADEKAQQLYQDLINSAYAAKVFKTSFFKRKAIEDFQTGWYQECLHRNGQ
jgi:signal recognition particle subunit SEC65